MLNSKQKEYDHRYFINYHTGAGNEYADTLEEAKEKAENGMCYTQQDVDIYDYETGEVVATSPWCGVPFGEFDEPICNYGDSGFYDKWSDEID